MKGSIPPRGPSATRFSFRFPRKSFILFAVLGIAGLTAAWAVGSSAGSIRAALFSQAAGAFGLSERPEEHLPESFEPPISPANGALETARSRHTATILADGRVLIAGGDSAGTSEIYDGATGISAPSGVMAAARSGHTGTRMSDGRVLVAGGSVNGSAVASTEIFDPASGTFSAGPNMGAARSGHTATTLSNGNILIAGGGSGSAEIFDGTTFTTLSGSMAASRTDASAVRMNDGRVFIAGGSGSATAEIYNPADGSFAASGNSMNVPRSRALLRVLPDGKIQIIGGNSDGSMEVYDPAINTIGAYAHVVPESDPCAGLINYVLAAETRAALIFSGSSAPDRDRSGHTITELGSTAVVIGGTSSGGAGLDSITVFQSSNATVTTDKLDYSPGQTVTVSGTGFAPGEAVAVKIHEDPHTEFERGLIEGNPVADASGNFTGTYLVQDVDLSMHFVVGARGLSSGRSAQTTFTDARNLLLTFAGAGTGSVTVTPNTGTVNAPVSCGGTGANAASQTVTSTCLPNITTSDNGATVTFSASASAGSTFGGWSAPLNVSASTCIGTTNPCSAVLGSNPSLTVTFNGNTNTTTTVASAANPSVFGQPVTFTATVTGTVSPTGSVQFVIDGSNFGSPVALVSATSTTAIAATSTSSLPVGSHTVSANYLPAAGFSASNGSVVQVVNKRSLNVTADNKTITYGAPDPAFTFTYGAQFVLGDDAGDIDVAPTCTVAGPHTNVGSYPIACSGGSDDNYQFNFVNGTLQITPATLNVNAGANTKVYGDLDPTFAYTLTGFKFSENSISASVSGTASCSRTPGETVAGSPYTITCVAGTLAAANYVFATGTTASFTITPATLSVHAAANTKIYGDADPTFGYTLSGFKFSEDPTTASVSGAAACSRAVGESVASGPYAITCAPGSLAAANYVFATGNTANFTITAATLSVNAVANTKVYGDPDPTFAHTLTGYKVSEDATSAGVTGAASCTRTLGESVAGSPYTITCAPGTLAAANYIFATGTSANFTITPAPLSVNAVANTKVYGDPDPAFAYALIGFKFGEDATTAAVTGAAICARTAGENLAGNPYAITCTPGSVAAANYYFATGTTASFIITPATLNVNAVANTKVYGDGDPLFSYTIAGFKFSEDATSAGVTGVASCTRTLGETLAGSPYTITCGPGSLAAANYVFATGTTASFTITASTLSVNAVADSKIYGDPDPVFAYTLSGFKFTDDATSAGVTGTASCTRAPGQSVAGSPYTITCAPGTLAAANYIFATGTTANFTITPATLTVNAVANSKTYGDFDPAFAYSLNGFKFSEDETSAGVLGLASCARTTGESVAGSPFVITCSAGTLAAANYVFVTGATANFTINKRLATWTTNPASKTYGDADLVPLTTGAGSNFVAGDNVTATYTRVAGENASPPTYHITAALSTTGDFNNYIITNDGAEFTINKRLATWTTNAASKTYGDVDPVPLTTGSGTNFVAADGVTATYSRVAGENASPPTYHITASLSATPLSALDNYVITNAGEEFTINKRLATWTTNAASKTYGDSDPAGLTTGSGTNFVASDNVTATYSRVSGENASPPTYHITATLATTGDFNNYIITNDGAEFTINKRLATWTTNPASKTYGEVDPVPLTTGSGTNFVATDNVAATYSRVGGESASTYHITATLSTTGDLNNYIITNDGAEFTINKRVATWTTNPASKTYGDADPAGVTTGSGANFVAADNVTATYSRVGGENASPPTYHITATLSATPLSALDNYIITNDGAEFAINKRLATWTTNPNSKTYGDLDPVGVTTGSGANFIAADNVTATYARVAGENASPPTYHITATLNATPLSALDNYIITNDGAEFTISKRVATWTTNPNNKTYGDLDPVGVTTGSGANFIAADNVTATYARVAGENASPPTYHITATLNATPLSALDNYIITNDGAEFTISKRVATWTTNPASKTYGDMDPAPLTSGSGSNFIAADNVTATYSRVGGENASPPTYHITATLSATPLSALDNYVISNDGAEFAINKRLATWTTNPNSKTYGDLDPSPLTTGIGTNFVAADNVTATYSRVAGENASPPTYHITATLSATPLSALDNYIISNDGAEFAINKRLATWTTNPNSKTYGDLDPAGVTAGSGTNFVAADNVTATYARVAGENASPPTYHITATLNATGDLNNYIITNDGAEFTINKRVATWTTNPASKTYGDLDPAPLTSGSGSNFVAADNVTATYARASGQNASPPTYHITATLSATPLSALDNYIITNNGAEFTINQRTVTVTADPKTKVYGNADPARTYQITVGSLAFSDAFSGVLSRIAGENVGAYSITQGTLTLGGNYILIYVPADLVITKRPITVTADAKTKVFSTADPPLTYQITSGSLAFSDPFVGALTRDAGELVGNYAILRGTLNINDGNGGNNYTFTYVGSYLTIVTGCAVFDGFRSPIGGAVELGTGGSFITPVRTFKLGSTIPVKWGATCFNTALVTGVHTLQVIKYSNATTVVGDPIDATPTDAATTGNQFRLTGTEWHYNLDTKKTAGLSEGTWLLRATLYDGSVYTVWISIKK